MNITRNRERERVLLDTLKQTFTLDNDYRRERTGIHLSDLLKTRQAYWGSALPMPNTDSEVLYFLAGRGHEEVFARLVGAPAGATEVHTVKLPGFIAGEQRVNHGVSYRPDFRWGGAPAEMKTRRANLAKEGEESVVYDNYIDQLWGYCALDDRTVGHLVVFSLLEGRSNDPLNPTHPELAVYDLLFTDVELSQMRAHLIEQRDLLSEARLLESHTQLPLCKPWMCGKNKKTVLRAAHCVECNKDYSEPWASKHTASKTGLGHTVTAEEVKWEYEPRCKWYVFCQPQIVDPTRGAR